jgi:signal transduction histidine kinase
MGRVIARSLFVTLIVALLWCCVDYVWVLSRLDMSGDHWHPLNFSIVRYPHLFLIGLAVCATLSWIIAFRMHLLKERREEQRELQLVQSGKLASIGAMAAGIAHEINNPLMVISGYINMLRKNNGQLPDERSRRAVETIGQSTERIRKITTRLLAFSRDPELSERQLVSLAKAVDDALVFFRPIFSAENIRLSVGSLDDRLQLFVNPINIESIFHNLLANSKDAFEASPDRQPDGGEKRVAFEFFPSAKTVRIVYSDNAGGMSPEAEKHLFDPFFTTKREGKGTGLGMALCCKLVRQMGGDIEVVNQLGQGVRFTIELPLFFQ